VNPRERLLTSLQHKEPDRIPLDLGAMMTTIEAEAYEKLKLHLGIDTETKTFMRDHVVPDERILKLLGVDTRYVRMNPSKAHKAPEDTGDSYMDEWGIVWGKPESSLYYDPIDHPLGNVQSIGDLDNYTFPNPYKPKKVEGVREQAESLYNKTDYAVVADAPQQGIFETACLLRGFDNFLEDLALREDFVKELLARICDYMIDLYDHFLSAVGEYVQVVIVGDDVAMQDRPLISPLFYRKVVKPFHGKLWSSIKKQTDAYLFLHSCGNVHPLIPDFMELGVDILNPIQVSAADMNTLTLKREFGEKLTFWGAIDTQKVLPYGSPQDVELEVKTRIKDLAPGGGYVLCAVHNIQADVGPENILAMYGSARKYGNYPIKE
jgi:uroporphyrinogen decarboxylase